MDEFSVLLEQVNADFTSTYPNTQCWKYSKALLLKLNPNNRNEAAEYLDSLIDHQNYQYKIICMGLSGAVTGKLI